jgi:hypothetical protein
VLDGLGIADIDLDAQSCAARSGDLGDRAHSGHILGFGLELLIRPQIEIGDRDLRPQSRQPSRIGAAEPARRAGNDRYLAVELAHDAHLPLKTGRRFSTNALLASRWSSVIAVRA